MEIWQGNVTPDKNAKFPLLISYAYLKAMKPDQIDKFVCNPYIELLLDSGAFTALNAGKEIDLTEYMEFLKHYKSKLFGYFALDKLGDTETTNKNFHKMIDQGLKPIPIHVRGAGQQEMDEFFEHSDWVGLGGFRRPHRGPASKEYVKQKMTWAKTRNVHWLGYTNKKMVMTFKPYSIDCSSWNSSLRYGTMSLYFGRGEWGPQLSCKDFQQGKYDQKSLQVIQRCGFTLEDAKNDACWRSDRAGGDKKFLTLHVSIHCWTRYIMDIRSSIGTRLFMAMASTSQIEEALKHIEKRAKLREARNCST